MKKAAFFVLLIATLHCACKKHDTATPSVMYAQWDRDTIMPTKNHMVGLPISNVSGILTSCKVSGSFRDTAGVLSNYNRSWQSALLTDIVSSARINTVALTASPYYDTSIVKSSLINYDDGTLWKEDKNNYWIVDGPKAPLFSTGVDGTMPVFTGNIPPTISRSTDFSYLFNESNVSGADSAYVIIYTYGDAAISPVVSTHGGYAKIGAAQLALPNYVTKQQIGFDGHVYNGTLLVIVLFNYSYNTFGNKRYAFVKQRVILSTIVLTN